MKKSPLVLSLVALALIAGAYLYRTSTPAEAPIEPSAITDYKQAAFSIEGEQLRLGESLQYFGNELIADVNDDGREDVVFLLTHTPGGSGTFFYVVAAINTESGYIGSDGYFLGDRIAPQTTELSQVPGQTRVVVVNYADRQEREPMTIPPSVGKSVRLKLDERNRWGIVEQNFSGEADFTERYSGVINGVGVVFEHKNYTSYRLTKNGQVDVGELNTERGFGDDIDATVYVLNWQQPETAWVQYVRLTNEPGVLYLLDSKREIVPGSMLRIVAD